jgi:hypothetical protein
MVIAGLLPYVTLMHETSDRTRPRTPMPLRRQDNLMRLLDQLEHETADDRVSVRDVLELLGPRAFTPMLLVPCLALVSPVSAVPGVPSFLSLLVGLVAVQMMFGQTRIWLPVFLLDRAIDASRLRRAVRALRRPVAVIDPWINVRLAWLTDKPGSLPALLIFCTVSFLMPLIEFVPFLTSTLASAMTLFAIGLFARDGLFMIAGYALVASGAALVTQAVLLLD